MAEDEVKPSGGIQLEKLYTTNELAEHLETNQGTLANWRTSGIGPRFVKVGASVRYREADVEDWLESRSAVTTADAP